MAKRKYGVLVASTLQTKTVEADDDVTLGRGPWEGKIVDYELDFVRLLNFGPSGVIYATVDGTTATVRGDDTFACPPGQYIDISEGVEGESISVKVISSGTPEYGLEGFSKKVG